jgi:hypothetical protein
MEHDTGAQLWSARFGGDFVGSPVMYEAAGRQYLLVPAASTAPQRPAAVGAQPLGWVAFALPAKMTPPDRDTYGAMR